MRLCVFFHPSFWIFSHFFFFFHTHVFLHISRLIMSVFKVRQSSFRLESKRLSIFEFINQNSTSFRQPNRTFSATAAARLIALSRTYSKAPFAAYVQHQNRNCSSARLLTSPFRDIKAPCDSLVEFIWKDVDKWSSHIAIVRFNFYFYQAAWVTY